jgi:hypothetical protein
MNYWYCVYYENNCTEFNTNLVKLKKKNYYNTYKKILLYGDRCLTGACCFWNYSPIGRNVCVILYIDFVRGIPFQKVKIIQKLSVTVKPNSKGFATKDTINKASVPKI